MKNINNYNYLLEDLTRLNGVGKKTMLVLRKKNVNNIFDLLWRLPQSYTDRSIVSKINELQIGKVHTLKIVPTKYSFPRIRNLPNKVHCYDNTGRIDCIFFNSYEGYIRKVLPLNNEITISGKVSFFKDKYQITNPVYMDKDNTVIEKIHNKYSLTEGISEKIYNKIINQILKNLPVLPEWINKQLLKKFDNETWNKSIIKLHDPKNIGNYKSNFYRRLAFDEILAYLLTSSQIRKKIKKVKKNLKVFSNKALKETISKLNFELTADQKKVLSQINSDLSSKHKMFRLLQGDVGCGKTIISLISALNVVESGYQVAIMAPTEILANQHYNLAKKIFNSNIQIDVLTSKIDNKKKKNNIR